MCSYLLRCLKHLLQSDNAGVIQVLQGGGGGGGPDNTETHRQVQYKAGQQNMQYLLIVNVQA